MASLGVGTSNVVSLETKAYSGLGRGLIFSSVWRLPFFRHHFGKSFIMLVLIFLLL